MSRLENWQEISKIVTHKLSKLPIPLDEARLEIFQNSRRMKEFRVPCIGWTWFFHLLEYDSYHQLEKKSNPAFNCTIGDKIHGPETKKN